MTSKAQELLDLASSSSQASCEALVRMRNLVAALRKDGLPTAQIVELTLGLAHSSPVRDWRKDPHFRKRVSVDLPSTGGASNKTPIVAPILALASAPESIFVPKVSTRGQVAGTIDILESVGYKADVGAERYREILAKTGIANVLPTAEMAPADAALMALRRKTGAMNIPELVIASILAKKIAAGCRNIVVDLKVGQDSKVGDVASALRAARLFVEVGEELGGRDLLDGIWVVGTNSYRTQGRTFGRIASLWEATRVLGGLERGFLSDLCAELAGRMLALAYTSTDVESAVAEASKCYGTPALSVARRWLKEHGVQTDFLDSPESLLTGLSRSRFAGDEGGRLLLLDSHRVAKILEILASDSLCHYAAGVVFLADPHQGRLLTPALAGEVLVPRGVAVDSSVLAELAEALAAHEGASPIEDRPPVLFEVASCGGRRLERTAWTRWSHASVALIRRAADTTQYLLVFNRKWESWNFLAGHAEDSDLTRVVTAEREIEEELGHELGEKRLRPGSDFECEEFRTWTDVWHSGSASELTFYDMTLVHARFRDPEMLEFLVQRHPDSLRWASDREIRRGRASDGADVSVFPASKLAMEGFLGGNQ